MDRPLTGLAAQIRDAALALGFVKVGFAPLEPFEEAGQRLAEWLASGYHGEMGYLAGEPRHEPRRLLEEARSLVVVALPWAPSAPRRPLPLEGLVARYAQGDDYHDVMRAKLRSLAERCAVLAGRPVLARPCVDSAPLLEGEAARLAGLGFIAKSTLLLIPGVGTQVVLGELLLDLELELDPPPPMEPRCGSCQACLHACPTSAFIGPYVLDARRCISYLTIELKGAVPRELRALVGTRVFGCDECQRVCPFNAAPERPSAAEFEPRPALATLDLVALLELGSAGYRKLVKKTALRRTNRERLVRNAAVALGNCGDPAAVPPLARALREHPSALVRGHAAWALSRHGGAAASDALQAARDDPDATVREEVAWALAALAAAPRAGG